MKNMKLFFTVLLLAVSFLGFSQKVKLKKGEVFVDDTVWLKYNECGSFDSTCSLLSKSGEEILFFKFISVDGAEPRIPSNPQGTLRYVEISFLGLNKKIELKKTQKDCIELLYNSKVVNEDGTLNPEKVDRLVEKHGTEFSDRLNGNSTTIIVKEEPRRNGVNINLGR